MQREDLLVAAQAVTMYMPDRRERIATAALQGLLASQVPGCTWGHERAAVESVEYADALIAALDASNESEGDDDE